MTATVPSSSTSGRVLRITGPVVDVEFPRDAMPELFTALHAEVEFEALAQTLPLKVVDVEFPRDAMPELFTALGNCLDEPGYGKDLTHWGIHRPAPAFDQLEGRTEMLETGLKVVDLLTPYVRGGKIGQFGGAGGG